MKGWIQGSLLLVASFGTALHGEIVEAFLPQLPGNPVAVRDLTIRHDGKELYLTSQSLFGEISAIMRMELEGDQWEQTGLASFSGNYKDLEPFLSPDGRRLYFASDRPRGDSLEAAPDYDIWYVERDGLEDAWGEPVNLGAPVNTDGNEFYPAVTSGGDLYFTSDRPGTKGKDDIFHAKKGEQGYADPVSLGEAINSEGYEFNAFVAPDGSYLIYTAYNRADGLGSGDLYISHRQADGGWSDAQNLGPEINSNRMDYCPFVDGAGTLYFTSKRIAFPEAPFGFETAEAVVETTSQHANGQSRLFRILDPKLLDEQQTQPTK
jgi:hypothetical protein